MKKYISLFLVKFPSLICYSAYYFFIDQLRNKKKKIRIFVLDEFRFREDIEILRQATDIEYVGFPNILQDKILGVILYANNGDIKSIERELPKFIKLFCSMYSSVGFISAGMQYKRHEPWEKATLLVKKSFFCLHREGVGCDYNFLKKDLNKATYSSKKFKGTKLFVATNSFKRFLVESQYYTSNEIVVTGLPRFDKIYHSKKTSKDSNILVLFSFFIGSPKESGLFPKCGGYRDFFNSVHGVVANYALNNPNITVYIKPKWYEGDAKESIDRAISKSISTDASNIKNLHITDEISAQNLIKRANTVISFNSTTLVESILYERKVIMPKYFEAAESHKDYVYYSDYSDIFYCPNSPEELLKTIENCMSNNYSLKNINHDFIADVSGDFDGLVCNRIEMEIVKYSTSLEVLKLRD